MCDRLVSRCKCQRHWLGHKERTNMSSTLECVSVCMYMKYHTIVDFSGLREMTKCAGAAHGWTLDSAVIGKNVLSAVESDLRTRRRDVFTPDVIIRRSAAHHITFFLCWGGEVERSMRLKRRKITSGGGGAAWRSSSPPLSLPSPPVSLGLTFTHRRIYFLPPVARQQTGKSITWRRQILRKGLQEGDASGRCSM